MLQSAFQWGGEELAQLIPLDVKSNLARTFADGEVTWKWKFAALQWKDRQFAFLFGIKDPIFVALVPGAYLTRRLQIVLKLSKTVADVLLNFDLDQCAMGFNGTTVLMLHCARALETGYTVFCSDLVCCSSGQSRRSTQIGRVLKYADRGFGIRFLPSYMRELNQLASASPPSNDPAMNSTCKFRPNFKH